RYAPERSTLGERDSGALASLTCARSGLSDGAGATLRLAPPTTRQQRQQRRTALDLALPTAGRERGLQRAADGLQRVGGAVDTTQQDRYALDQDPGQEH